MGSKVISKMINNTIKSLIITFHEIMNTMNSDAKIMMFYNHNKNGHGKLLSYLSKLFVSKICLTSSINISLVEAKTPAFAARPHIAGSPTRPVLFYDIGHNVIDVF